MTTSFPNFLTSVITYWEKPSQLSSTSGNGQESPKFLSFRFQIIVHQHGRHPKEGLDKRTGGRSAWWEEESFLTGQYVTVWFPLDNIFMHKHLCSNITISTITNRVMITWCFMLGWTLNSRNPRYEFPHSYCHPQRAIVYLFWVRPMNMEQFYRNNTKG